jgi:hypothetical protein
MAGSHDAPRRIASEASLTRVGGRGLRVGAALLLVAFCLRDDVQPDLYFHLAAGRDMVRAGALLTRSQWLAQDDQPGGGFPFVDHEWAFQLAAWPIFQAGGPPALHLVKTLLAAVCLGGLLLAARRQGPARWMVAAPFILAIGPRLVLRPEVWAYAGLGAALGALAWSRWRPSTRLSVGLGLLQVVWTNVHGLALAIPLAVGATLAACLLHVEARRRGWRLATWLAEPGCPRRLAVALACVAVGQLCHAYGPRGALYVAEQAILAFTRDSVGTIPITEFIPPPRPARPRPAPRGPRARVGRPGAGARPRRAARPAAPAGGAGAGGGPRPAGLALRAEPAARRDRPLPAHLRGPRGRARGRPRGWPLGSGPPRRSWGRWRCSSSRAPRSPTGSTTTPTTTPGPGSRWETSCATTRRPARSTPAAALARASARSSTRSARATPSSGSATAGPRARSSAATSTSTRAAISTATTRWSRGGSTGARSSSGSGSAACSSTIASRSRPSSTRSSPTRPGWCGTPTRTRSSWPGRATRRRSTGRRWRGASSSGATRTSGPDGFGLTRLLRALWLLPERQPRPLERMQSALLLERLGRPRRPWSWPARRGTWRRPSPRSSWPRPSSSGATATRPPRAASTTWRPSSSRRAPARSWGSAISSWRGARPWRRRPPSGAPTPGPPAATEPVHGLLAALEAAGDPVELRRALAEVRPRAAPGAGPLLRGGGGAPRRRPAGRARGARGVADPRAAPGAGARPAGPRPARGPRPRGGRGAPRAPGRRSRRGARAPGATSGRCASTAAGARGPRRLATGGRGRPPRGPGARLRRPAPLRPGATCSRPAPGGGGAAAEPIPPRSPGPPAPAGEVGLPNLRRSRLDVRTAQA